MRNFCVICVIEMRNKFLLIASIYVTAIHSVLSLVIYSQAKAKMAIIIKSPTHGNPSIYSRSGRITNEIDIHPICKSLLLRIQYLCGLEHVCRSQWPRGLRHVLSSLARMLGVWVRIQHKAWMFGVYLCLLCVFVVLCLGRGLATG
jgi:hypothetical protein